MSLDKDNDAQEAFNMIDYFKRNGVPRQGTQRRYWQL